MQRCIFSYLETFVVIYAHHGYTHDWSKTYLLIYGGVSTSRGFISSKSYSYIIEHLKNVGPLGLLPHFACSCLLPRGKIITSNILFHGQWWWFLVRSSQSHLIFFPKPLTKKIHGMLAATDFDKKNLQSVTWPMPKLSKLQKK